MEQEGLRPDKVSYVGVLNACAKLAALEEGKYIHARITRNGYGSDVPVGSSLIDMYTKCSSLEDARQVFDKLLVRNVVLWTAMIAGYEQLGQDEAVLHSFEQMKVEAVEPDEFVFAIVLNSCASLASLDQGKQIHVHILSFGYELDLFVGTALVNMYIKCKSLLNMCRVFDSMPQRNACTWTIMIGGYANHGQAEKALRLFQQMACGGVRPDKSTFVSVLTACASLAAVEQGKQVHTQIIEYGFESDKFVGSALVDMYAKCGSLENACQVFDELPERDVVAWTAMIAGCTQQEQGEAAFTLWWQMEMEGVTPDELTCVSVLNACAGLAALELGKQIHYHIVKVGIKPETAVGATLVDMYAKCGSLDNAYQVFKAMPARDVVSWNAIIAAYAQHGQGKEVFRLIQEMQSDLIKLDHITFLGVFSACSHVGLVNEGLWHFDLMTQAHGIAPISEHYGCIIDLLGRAGHLEKAHEFIIRMPCQPRTSVWRALLGACRIHGDLHLARRAAEHILELEPQDTAAFVLLSNIYADAVKGIEEDDYKYNRRQSMEDSSGKQPPHVAMLK